jgi:hypothetical protein
LAPKYVKGDLLELEKKNEEIEDALALWKICEYKWVKLDEINEQRSEGNPNAFYWKTIPIYGSANGEAYISYSMNFFLTCEHDNIVYYWYEGKKMKANMSTKIQKGIRNNAAKYRKELSIK